MLTRISLFPVLGSLALLAVSCAEPEPEPSEPPPPTPLGPCVAPDDLASDPLTQTGSIDLRGEVTTNIVHTLDVAVTADQQRAYTVGVGGFFVLDPTQDTPQFLGHLQTPPFDVLEIVDSERVVVGGAGGFRFLDVSDSSSPALRAGVPLDGVSGLGWDGSSLWLSTHFGEVSSWGVDSGGPTELGRLENLGNLWDLVLDNQGRGYAADNAGQIHVLDLADPSSPTVLNSVPASAGIQGLALSGDRLAAALGAGGIEIFSLVDPEDPESVSLVQTGSSVVAVELVGDLLWGADIDGVVAIDVSSPEAPKTLAFEASEEWTMGIAAMGEFALGAGWSFSDRYSVGAMEALPVVVPNPSELIVPDGGGETTFHLVNRGSSDLIISGASVSDERLSLSLVETTILSPAGELEIVLDFDGAADGDELVASVCLATNDPSQPVVELPVIAGGAGETSIAVGELAVDFSLPSLDGEVYQLSDHIGSPVLLVYFATW